MLQGDIDPIQLPQEGLLGRHFQSGRLTSVLFNFVQISLNQLKISHVLEALGDNIVAELFFLVVLLVEVFARQRKRLLVGLYRLGVVATMLLVAADIDEVAHAMINAAKLHGEALAAPGI